MSGHNQQPPLIKKGQEKGEELFTSSRHNWFFLSPFSFLLSLSKTGSQCDAAAPGGINVDAQSTTFTDKKYRRKEKGGAFHFLTT